MKKSNPVALLPILVFLILYLGLGIVFEVRPADSDGLLQYSDHCSLSGGHSCGLSAESQSIF